MSGVKRNILADVTRNGDTSEEGLKKAFSPEAMRAETGRADEDRAEKKDESGE